MNEVIIDVENLFDRMLANNVEEWKKILKLIFEATNSKIIIIEQQKKGDHTEYLVRGFVKQNYMIRHNEFHEKNV